MLFLSNKNEIYRGNIMANKSKAYWLPMPCIALFFFETAKLFKPIGVPISCHPIQLVQPWSPSRKPLKFSTKRRSQCSSHIASFWTMKVRSISKWDQHPSQLFGFPMVGSQRGMPACHSWSHWGNSLKPETKRSRKSIVKIQVMETIICLTSRKQIHQPRKKGLLHHHHVWWPSLWVTNLWIAWYLARSSAGARPLGPSDLPLEARHYHCFGAAYQIPQDHEVRQLVAYQLREMEEKSCSQTLYGYPYSQFAASIGEALSLPFMSQSQANGPPWQEIFVHFLYHIRPMVHPRPKPNSIRHAIDLQLPWLCPKMCLKRPKPPKLIQMASEKCWQNWKRCYLSQGCKETSIEIDAISQHCPHQG